MSVRDIATQDLETDPYVIYKELRDREPVAFLLSSECGW